VTPWLSLTVLQRYYYIFFLHERLQLIIRIELATSWMADLLGYRSQESYHCPVSIWYVGQCDSYNSGQADQLRSQARSWMVVPITRKHTNRLQAKST
jgi:hypothetical protein